MRFLRLTFSPDLLDPRRQGATGEVLNLQYVSDGTVLELYAVDGDLDAILDGMATSEDTFAYEHLGTRDGRHYVFQHGRPSPQVAGLIELLEAHHLMVVLPFTFDETAGVTVDVVGDTDAIQAVYREFPPEIRRQTTIEQLGEYIPTRHGILSVLTERQREVLHTAVDVGYYATPRTGTAEDVAAAVGCAPSTASEHLRKLEARLFGHLVSP